MNKIFKRVNGIVAQAWTGLEEIPWQDYADGLDSTADGDVKKWTGILFRFDDQPVKETEIRVHGYLLDTRELEASLATEVRMLLANPTCLSSMGLRYPSTHELGVGVRAHHNFGTLSVIAGLPEIGNLLATAETMYRGGFLNRETLQTITDYRWSPLAYAMAHVGMSRDKFLSLKEKISSIFAPTS